MEFHSADMQTNVLYIKNSAIHNVYNLYHLVWHILKKTST